MLVWLAQTSLQRLSQWLFAAVAIGAVALVVFLLFPRRKRPDPLDRPRQPSLAQQRAVERDMHDLLAELSDMARRVTDQLDERAARIEQLIAEADRRIERLNEPPRSRHAPLDDDGPIISIGGDPEPDPRHQQVYTLMDEGLNARQIAQRLNFPEGEIELIMALRPGPRERV